MEDHPNIYITQENLAMEGMEHFLEQMEVEVLDGLVELEDRHLHIQEVVEDLVISFQAHLISH